MEIIAQAAACYYSFESSHILVAAVDSERNLIIQSEATYTDIAISEISEILDSLDIPVWTNKHEPLSYSLDRDRGYLDFDQENEVKTLHDLYKSLVKQNRLKAPNMSLSGQNVENCFKILLKALVKDLCQKPTDVSFCVGEPRDVYRLIESYW